MKKALLVAGLFLLCNATSQIAQAKEAVRTTNFGLHHLGVEAGLVDPEAAGSTLGFGVFADLGNVSRDVRLSSHLGYWSISDEDFGVEASVRDISFGARAKYMFRVSSPKLQPYAGAGLGLHFFNSKVEMPEQDFGGGFIVPGFSIEDSSTELGLDLGGGAIKPLNPKTDLFFDLWYTMAEVDQLSMKVGVSFLIAQ